MSKIASDIEFLFNAAVGFQKDGNLQRASELYDRIHTIDPAHVMSLNNQALIARALGRLDLSLAMLRKAKLSEPDNFEILANLGRVSLQKEHFSEAEYYLKKALVKKPDDKNLRRCLDKAMLGQNRVVYNNNSMQDC